MLSRQKWMLRAPYLRSSLWSQPLLGKLDGKTGALFAPAG